MQAFWLGSIEYCPVGHTSQVRSVLLVPLAAIFWPATQLAQMVQVSFDEDPLTATKAAAVQLRHVEQAAAFSREENVPVPHAEHDLSLDEVPSAETKLPALQLRHVEQARAFSREENVPDPHAEHDLSLVAVPFAETKAPAVQLRRCEHAPWLDPVEKVCDPHDEHARSEVEEPAALTKVPPPQTVQGVHLAVGGRLDSDTLLLPK